MVVEVGRVSLNIFIKFLFSVWYSTSLLVKQRCKSSTSLLISHKKSVDLMMCENDIGVFFHTIAKTMQALIAQF